MIARVLWYLKFFVITTSSFLPGLFTAMKCLPSPANALIDAHTMHSASATNFRCVETDEPIPSWLVLLVREANRQPIFSHV